MVLQRDSKVNIWGWADNNETVTITFNGRKYKTKAGEDGKWKVVLAPLKAGGPYTMNIDATNHITLSNILVGDVWFCSGQSNMVHQMDLHKERYANEIAQANFSAIRHFWIPTLTDLKGPKEDLPMGSWKSANPKDVLQFSAVAYFFAKAIYEKYHVPIGLINASVGGTPIEAWTSEEGFKDFPTIISTIEKNKDTAYVNGLNRKASAANANTPQRQQDKGLLAAKRWYDSGYIPKGWHTINIPGYWEDQGIKDLDGAVWYRREIDVPISMIGKPAKIALGRIVDADFLYVNGKLAGNTTYMYPQRRYALPAGVLKPGKNVFVIRVLNNFGKGGFVPDKPYYLSAGSDTIDLKGTWQYKVGEVYTRQGVGGGGGISAQNQPTSLYNAMAAPVNNFTIKGVLWYQGESNINNAAEYDKLLPGLIADWRSKWKQPDLPFLYVQLPNFQEVQYVPSESPWAVLREAQLKTLSVQNTGMAVAIDLGEWNDIHPDRKKEVGDRLALAAMKVAYHDGAVVPSGPLFKAAAIEGNKIVLTFDHVGGGLIANDGEELYRVEIAGADKKFVWATAKIEGDKVVVWSDHITNPMFVRYAWADNPDGANLYNKEGLPASPFRTDH
ncbi:9-O-acetylesterase [Segetibacter aerophilus]|uniref:9-O-acetylesterase n=2 Tax=Segetibacter aerophilus TaxID=670293 RepID=A0A512BHH2_9BACT|nr:9-O-acetylesterase [Segetibacter aerophilus]